jgi:hypothetical protein
MKHWTWAMAFAAGLACAAEQHGRTDVFVAPGVALAWAVARGADEAATTVVIRVLGDGSYGALSVVGEDPFTRDRFTWMKPTALSERLDVRIPRGRFAEFPRTELRFHAALPADPVAGPALRVFYLGIPDTTPEFDDRAKLDRYLDERLAGARANPQAAR